MKALILAAGVGSRLRPFTDTVPKPAIPFLGVPLIRYGVDLAIQTGVSEFVVNHHHLSEQIINLFKNSNLKVSFSDESKQLMDSGGALHQAKALMSGQDHFFVINGDEVILPHEASALKTALEFHMQNKNLVTICVKDHPGIGEKFGGVWTDDNNDVICFSKKPVQNLKGWHYIGVIIFSKEIFSYFSQNLKPSNILYDTVTSAIQNQEQVKVYNVNCEWFETGNPQDFIDSTKICLEAMKTQEPMPWAARLKKFIGQQIRQEPIIEKSDKKIYAEVCALGEN